MGTETLIDRPTPQGGTGKTKKRTLERDLPAATGRLKIIIVDEDGVQHELGPDASDVLVVPAGVADMLEVSHQRVTQLARTKDFPEPALRVGKFTLWFKSEVDEFGRQRKDRVEKHWPLPKGRGRSR